MSISENCDDCERLCYFLWSLDAVFEFTSFARRKSAVVYAQMAGF